VLTLVSTPDDLMVPDPVNTPIDGAIVYGWSVALAQRVGMFVSTGTNMQIWAACGQNLMGLVHNQLLSDTGVYTGLVWRAPPQLPIGTNITFMGAAVTDNGYGAHSTNIIVFKPNLNAPPPPPQLTKFLYIFGSGVGFFTDAGKAATFNPAKSFTVTIKNGNTVVATMSDTSSPVISNSLKSALSAANAFGVNLTVQVAAVNTVGSSWSNILIVNIPASAQILLFIAPVTPPPPANPSPALNSTANTPMQPLSVSVSNQAVMSLCDVTTQAALTQYDQNTDPDNACAYQDTLMTTSFNANTGNVNASPALQVAAAVTLLLPLFVSLLTLFSKVF